MRRTVQLSVGDTNGRSQIVIRQLKIQFDVDKNASSPHTAVIQVYNLAPDTRRALNERFTLALLEYGVVERVGDPEVLRVVFLGQIYNTTTTRNASTGDTITTLYCGSGLSARANATIQQTFSASAGLGELVRAMTDQLNSLGVATGFIDPAIDDVEGDTTRGTVLSGAVETIMANMLEGTGFTFMIDGDQAIIQQEKTADTANIVVTPATGLVGSARRTHQGFDFTSVLNPAIKPGATVGVYSEFADDTRPGLNFGQFNNQGSAQGGLVRVLSLKHTGSNYDGQATTSVVGIR